MWLNHNSSGEKWKVRPDGVDKVTGKLRYLTDITFPNMLYGRVLRSGVPHARIKSIDITAAVLLPGVEAVLTHEDIPGLNGFGISTPDQPVFAHEVVRFEGDAVAAVAAISEDIAKQALALIQVDYEQLPIIDTPEKALAAKAPQLHETGNVLHQTEYVRGDIEEAFSECVHIVEETYTTPRQMHTYLETEGGIFVFDKERLIVYAPTQHGYKDRMQLSRILNMTEESIRVVSSPIGGSFGGKDELNCQPYGALLAIYCGKPVKMHYSRWESVVAGLKRHPMKVMMKTGIDDKGKILAHQVQILSDTGAYSTLGGPVLNFATEHAMGPYQIANVEVKGKAVYTNNGVSGEFRGFGGNQVIFALEGQIDRLAEKAKIEAWELRKTNLRKHDDLGPLGQRIVPTKGPDQVWEAIKQSSLWKKRKQKVTGELPWIKRGIGVSMAMHGSGLGYGIPDYGGGTIRLNAKGQIEVAFGHEEFGQGLLATLEILLMEHFQCAKEDISIVIGDTDLVPSSGSSTASRTTNMVWQSLNRLKKPFLTSLFNVVSEKTGYRKDTLKTGKGGVWSSDQGEEKLVMTFLELMKIGGSFEETTNFHYPVTPDPIMGGHYLYTSTSVIAEVEVNVLTGMVVVKKVDHAVAAGPVVNPMGYLGQIEGGGIMALGFTLTEDSVMKAGNYITKNLDSYLIPTIYDVPEDHGVLAIQELPENDSFGPRGVGEVGSVALAPAIIAAVKDATGVWITELPIKPELLIRPFEGESVEVGGDYGFKSECE
ncbi:xanthine dehydrogenase subunit D [Halalkalibacter akibai]|uniref:Xanthine dehydrogenase n=1 Tax=Halalkalibacter akibai (strain ATCC 43226 / DSM 21942 / CIP 109018 / JCM 9157 / 1139) TaxID=1236973 RepID=W4R0F7_HALA3|nr:xanthine dehydrogenase subunit D [Halalkalibacter akibai]GAE37034.1 xanthine dehydrogenase [Halalkalibacter akibai JCM 9157]